MYCKIACFDSSKQLIFASFVIYILVARFPTSATLYTKYGVATDLQMSVCARARASFNDGSILYKTFNIRSGGKTISIGLISIGPYSAHSLWKMFVTQPEEKAAGYSSAISIIEKSPNGREYRFYVKPLRQRWIVTEWKSTCLRVLDLPSSLSSGHAWYTWRVREPTKSRRTGPEVTAFFLLGNFALRRVDRATSS